MTQLRQIETQVEDSAIKPGDIVRLRKPFRPERFGSQEYAFAIVAGVIKNNSNTSNNYQSVWDSNQTAQRQQTQLDELVVYLYDQNSSTIYVDRLGIEALFSFDFDEVELYKVIHISASLTYPTP